LERIPKNGENLSVTIKEMDENVFRNFKAEAIRHGLKIGEATTEALRLWMLLKKYGRVRDRARALRAAKDMNRLREKSKRGWSGAQEIRKWRELRK
jgi:hypothetical protein